jgi:hypothetical protein
MEKESKEKEVAKEKEKVKEKWKRKNSDGRRERGLQEGRKRKHQGESNDTSKRAQSPKKERKKW